MQRSVSPGWLITRTARCPLYGKKKACGTALTAWPLIKTCGWHRRYRITGTKPYDWTRIHNKLLRSTSSLPFFYPITCKIKRCGMSLFFLNSFYCAHRHIGGGLSEDLSRPQEDELLPPSVRKSHLQGLDKALKALYWSYRADTETLPEPKFLVSRFWPEFCLE